MEFLIYLLAGISILLAIGGLSGFKETGRIGLLISSVVSIVFSCMAISMTHWWPLAAGFAINAILGMLGLDPSQRGEGQ